MVTHSFYYSNHVFFVVKPWLICGYHSLTIVTMFFCGKTMVNLWLPQFYYSNHVFFCGKTMVNLWLPQFNYSNHVFCGKTMVNLWLPQFYYSNHVFLVLFVVKPWLIFIREEDRSQLLNKSNE